MDAIQAAVLSNKSGCGEEDMMGIYKAIEKMAKEGGFTLIVQGLTSGQEKKLTSLGYKVEISSRGYADKISWG